MLPQLELIKNLRYCSRVKEKSSEKLTDRLEYVLRSVVVRTEHESEAVELLVVPSLLVAMWFGL